MRIIKLQDGQASVGDDPWAFVDDGAPVPEQGDVIVTAQRWAEEHAALRARDGRVGVQLSNDDDVMGVDLDGVELVALSFPKFSDGRAYSQARLLRDRRGFAGQLRARGNVLRDQLFYMARCGIDAFELTAGKDIDSALEAFREYSVTYQPAADDPRPLWRRVAR